jgi:hypothetical protein
MGATTTTTHEINARTSDEHCKNQNNVTKMSHSPMHQVLHNKHQQLNMSNIKATCKPNASQLLATLEHIKFAKENSQPTA